MPQIKEYIQRAEVSGPVQGRRASSEEFGMMGRALQQAGGAIQQTGEVIYKRAEQSEISDASVKMSEAHAEFTNKLNTDLQKGTVNAEEFTKQYDDYMAKVSEGFSTRGAKQYLQKSSASMRAHFLESSFAAQSELAGVKTRENYNNTLKNFSSGLMGDPSSYETVREVHNTYLQDLVANGGLPAAVAEKLRTAGETEIAKSAVRGWVDLNPNEAKAQLASGKWDTAFDGDVKKQLLGEAEMGIRSREIEYERQQREAEKIKVQQQQQTQNQFLEKMVSGQLSAKEILKSNLDAFGSGSKQQFLNLMETNAKESERIKTNPGTFVDLFNRVHLPDGDPNKITDENQLNQFLGKGLTLEDIKNLRGEMQGKGTMAGKEESIMKQRLMDTAKNRLTKSNPMLGIKDPHGDEQLARYQNLFMTKYAEGRKAGKSATDLLSPDSPEYLGKFIGDYAKSPQQIMNDLVKMNRQQPQPAQQDGTAVPTPQVPPANVRKPGETVEQWRARTKGNK